MGTTGQRRRVSSMKVLFRFLVSDGEDKRRSFSNSVVERMNRTHGGSSDGSQCSVPLGDVSPARDSLGKATQQQKKKKRKKHRRICFTFQIINAVNDYHNPCR